MKIIVGSKNVVKIAACRDAFLQLFPDKSIEVEGVKAPSGVSDQPMSHEETLRGAINRAQFCKENHEADFYLGLEGGMGKFPDSDELGLMGWVAVISKDSDIVGKGGGAMLALPIELCNMMKEEGELAPAADKYFKAKNIRETSGTVGALTNGLISRSHWFEDAIILAMAVFIN